MEEKFNGLINELLEDMTKEDVIKILKHMGNLNEDEMQSLVKMVKKVEETTNH